MSALEPINAEAVPHGQDWRMCAVRQLLYADVAISHGLTEVAREHISDAVQTIINDLLDGGDAE